MRLRIRLSVCTGKRIYIVMLAAKISRVKSLQMLKTDQKSNFFAKRFGGMKNS